MSVDRSKYSFVTQADYEAVAGPDWPQFSAFITHQDIPDFVYHEIDTMLGVPELFSHPSFCILPFYGVEYPLDTFCCLASGSTSREAVKKEMLNGQRPNACNKCWTIEDAGLKSDRILKNETLDFYTNRNIKDLYQECTNGHAEIVHYKIDTNNVCNATCVTCGGGASSAWAKLEKDQGLRQVKTWQLYPADMDKKINYHTAKSIGFRGGEPFMSKTNFYILEKLAKAGNYNCFISFTTNGSFELTDKQISLIKQFPNMNFCFSIDGIGPVFEYVRYPLKFDQIKKNIEFCRTHNIIASVSYTLSNLNILYHNQTVEWFEQNCLKYIINPVYSPRHFRPGALPEKVKHQIKQTVKAEIQNLISTHSALDDQDFEKFKQEIAKQDGWKNIQLKHYLPELAKTIDQ
jgi:pyruvate-formate lyase-activating enzyme